MNLNNQKSDPEGSLVLGPPRFLEPLNDDLPMIGIKTCGGFDEIEFATRPL